MSRLLDWIFNRTTDEAVRLMDDASNGLLHGDGPNDVAEVEEIDHDDC